MISRAELSLHRGGEESNSRALLERLRDWREEQEARKDKSEKALERVFWDRSMAVSEELHLEWRMGGGEVAVVRFVDLRVRTWRWSRVRR